MLIALALTAAQVSVPAQPALTEQIAAADEALFAHFFSGPCDATKFRSFLADDVEFYHDKAGFNVRTPEDFVAIFSNNCSGRQDPVAWRTRRALVRESLHVDPVPDYGAMETGEHLFYERQGEKGEEKLAGRARFAHLWVLGADGKWRLSRVLSYAHGPAK